MTAADTLRCRELVELATGYLEGALPASEWARVELHLARCAPCATYLAQLRQTVRWLGQMTAEAVAPHARQELRGLFRAWQRGSV
jgi:anti-sigma factor RsiW